MRSTTKLSFLPPLIPVTEMFNFITSRFKPLKEYRVIYRDIDAQFYMSTLVKARNQYWASRAFDQDERFIQCVRIFTTPV